MSKKTGKSKLEGEGSYSATRGYNAGLAEYQRTADVAGAARKAAKASDGKEGKALRQAEGRGKRGPTRKALSRPSRGASAQR